MSNLEMEVQLEQLVREIFKIIPSYYDEREAEEIKELIKKYIESLKNT